MQYIGIILLGIAQTFDAVCLSLKLFWSKWKVLVVSYRREYKIGGKRKEIVEYKVQETGFHMMEKKGNSRAHYM